MEPGKSEPGKAESADGAKDTKEENQFAKAGEIHLDVTAYVMLALALLVIAVAVDRAYVIFLRNSGNDAALVTHLTESLIKDPQDVSNVISEISQPKYGLSGRAAATALKGWNHGIDTIAKYAETALAAERRNLDRRLIVLNTLGNNIPFIGLLGTVLGIMKSFRDLALAGGDAGPAVVMVGISEALVATAMGLAVAVPTVILYNWLSKGAKNRIGAAEEIVHLIQAIRLSVNPNGSSGHFKPVAKEAIGTGAH